MSAKHENIILCMGCAKCIPTCVRPSFIILDLFLLK